MVKDSNIIYLPSPSPPQVLPVDSYDDHRTQHTPLIIDNGSTHLRWGFSTAATPHCGLNMVAKYKERKNNRLLLLFGAAIDAENGARGQARLPWEGDVLLNFDALENVLDYAFIQLGIDSSRVEHPVLMTERLSSPLHSRALTSELMFEQYNVLSLAYCVDSLMSFYQNNFPENGRPHTSDGLIVSLNTASTAIIPVLNGKGILSHAKRIPWGTQQSTDFLLKLIQLKYPNFITRVTSTQTSWMLRHLCEFAVDYPSLLRSLKDPLRMRVSERIVQFPFAAPLAEEKSEEEIARIAEKRREQGKKLQELAAKNRMDKLLQKENDLQYLINFREGRGENKREWMNTLQSEGFEHEAALEETIRKLEFHLKRSRKKDLDGDELVDEPTFPLLDVLDADLDEEGLKEKRKQKLQKAGFEARARSRREKEKEREEKETEERRDEAEREQNLEEWGNKMRREQEALMNKIKDRSRRRAALSDRKSAAAQARMKNIASLAADDRISKKKRKAGGDDTFGADDDDWAIYRQINIGAASSDEDDDLHQLQAVEQKLLMYDPTFTTQHTHASLISQQSALISAFRPRYEEPDIEGNSRIHLNVERWRACEVYFSPAMAGVDSAGLGEVIQGVLARFTDNDKARLCQNIFVTGTPCQFPGLIPRLRAAIRPILAPEMPLKISRSADSLVDGWRGMAAFANTPEFQQVSVTKAEYEEWGGERIKRWWGGNWNSSVMPFHP